MKVLPFILILCALVSFVCGQLLFKRAMEESKRLGFKRDFITFFLPGMISMTVSFFLTLGLLQRFDLSYIYPFQGLSVIIVSLLGGILLKERLTLQLILGALLISAGIVFVSLS